MNLEKPENGLSLLNFWPPSENTRKMLVDRTTYNLSSPATILTRRYGCLSKDEAVEKAKEIDEAAFCVANKQYDKEGDGDGCWAVKLYAKECSKLIIEALKKGPKTESVESDDDVSFSWVLV